MVRTKVNVDEVELEIERPLWATMVVSPSLWRLQKVARSSLTSANASGTFSRLNSCESGQRNQILLSAISHLVFQDDC
jgi:hypothetical protein